jgi:hypothetical protein
VEVTALLQFVRLIVAILIEGLASLGFIALFLVRRRTERAKVEEVMLGRGIRPKAMVGVALYVLVGGVLTASLIAGCSSSATPARDSASVSATNRATPSSKEYKDPFIPRHPGTSFQYQIDQFKDSVETIANMDDAESSLEDDLREFGSTEPNALWETLSMLGF